MLIPLTFLSFDGRFNIQHRAVCVKCDLGFNIVLILPLFACNIM
jgi:hypothetical protein